MKYTITENRLERIFNHYMDSVYDLKYDYDTREFVDKDGVEFGYFLTPKSKHFQYCNYPTDVEYLLTQMFGELTNELLFRYIKERFPDVRIDGVD